jgi:hypothetical protein
VDDLASDLENLTPQAYGGEFAAHLLEQYKLYVQMADKISERRQAANSFFVAINTALATLLGFSKHVQTQSNPGSPWVIAVGFSGMILSYTWYRLIRSYRDLNAGKFRVIQAMEAFLPLRPYTAEWTVVVGSDRNRYLPFTHVETKVPWVFFSLHLALIVMTLAP